MSLFQFTARRLVSQAYCGLKAASSSKTQKFRLEMARPSSRAGYSRGFCAKPFSCVGILPLSPGSDAEQTSQSRTCCHCRVRKATEQARKERCGHYTKY
uniref:Uncharacterized protein n=1 Tax=Strix occidentalis caurina TaxID=311401 RepID=A0A8D0FYM0_STROC